MSYPFLSHFTDDVIRDYTKTCVPTGDWVSYRHPSYAVNSVSMREGRYNESGEAAYYLASGVWLAKKEVPDYPLKELHQVSPHEIRYFDLYQFSKDRGFHEDFLKAQKDDGWKLCQAASTYLTSNHNLSGIAYASYQAHTGGQFGLNMVILPGRGNLVGDTFFVKADNPKGLTIRRGQAADC